MSAAPASLFQRNSGAVLAARLGEPRRFLQVVAGPRQVGKTTLVQQVLAEFDRPNVFVSADEPALRDAAWLAAQWERARLLAKDAGKRGTFTPEWKDGKPKRLATQEEVERSPRIVKVVRLESYEDAGNAGELFDEASRVQTEFLKKWLCARKSYWGYGAELEDPRRIPRSSMGRALDEGELRGDGCEDSGRSSPRSCWDRSC